MVNLCDTLVQCSRFEATRSYSSAALGNRSCSSLGVHGGRIKGQQSESEQQERLGLYYKLNFIRMRHRAGCSGRA